MRLDLGIFVTTRPTFNYFGHFHNYDATIKNFILLVASILHIFSSINKLICPINRNNHQISCILKVFYNDIGVYFNVCTKIIHIYNMHRYVYCSYNESQNKYFNFEFIFFKSENWYFNYENFYFNFLKNVLEFQIWYLNLKFFISIV
jgi:hypothetical protein